MVKVFFDVETTGTNHKIHAIHQLAGLIEVNGEVVEKFDFKVRPPDKAQYDPAALRVCNKTQEEIMLYPSMKDVHWNFIAMLNKYIDRYNPKQKAKLIGFNNRSFDDNFLRMFFELSGDSFFGSYFWSDSLDVLVLASEYLEDRRADMPSFKLKRVGLTLGLVIEKEGLHDALYDAELTRKIYRIVTNLDLEI